MPAILRSVTAKASNPYVIALVDGDGAIFQDSLMRNAETGGSLAGSRLKRQIGKSLGTTPLEHGLEVFARVYANFRGLGRVLSQSGLIRYSDDLQRFARGFTNTRPGFDFVDVDYGKENADSKIRRECCVRTFFCWTENNFGQIY